MTDSFLTLSAPGEAQYVEKRSRFLAFAAHVETEDEAKAYVADMRRKYYDARHVCYAWALGPNVWTDESAATTRSNDDGEPSGSAGKPMLGQLRSRSLTDAVVVVVRYFGGVKLGTGGLAVAYKTAAGDALDAATVEERLVMSTFTVEVPYADADTAMRFIREGGAEISARDYTATTTLLTVSVRRSLEAALRERLQKLLTLRFV